MVFVACTGVAVLLQAIVLLCMFIAIRKTAQTIQSEMHELRGTITPVLTQTRDFLTTVAPKVDSITTDLVALAHGLRTQGEELQVSANDMLERVRRQSSRLDVMLSSVLDSVDHAGSVVTQAVNVPVRQLGAVTAFVKAAVGTLISGPPRRDQPTHNPADKDLFV